MRGTGAPRQKTKRKLVFLPDQYKKQQIGRKLKHLPVAKICAQISFCCNDLSAKLKEKKKTGDIKQTTTSF